MGSVGKSSNKQVATKAKLVENMNEAQIDKEIAKEEKKIANAEKIMQATNITNTAENKAMQEAFPLGAGGMSQAQIKKKAKQFDIDAKKATQYVNAMNKKVEAQNKIETLQDAKKQIAGTGKTLAQVKEEKVKNAVKATENTLKWKTTQKEEWANGGYQPKIITAGNIEIHGSQGFYRVYKDGKLIGSTSKLNTAKAIAEKVK